MSNLRDTEMEPRRRRRLSRPSYANVMSTLAVLFALTGGGADASPELINSCDVQNESLTGADIRGRAATSTTPYVNGSLTGYDVANGSIRRDDIGANSVDSARVVDGSLAGADLRNGTVTAADLAPSQAWRNVAPAPDAVDTSASGRFFCHIVHGDCESAWANYGGGFNSAGYYKDALGVVHLKGIVTRWWGGEPPSDDPSGIFRLPPGYRPAAREVHVTMFQWQLARVDIFPDGLVKLDFPPNAPYDHWLSLDGITFRAAN